ncbi:VRR-NUC domain-containing protein [Burkholderia multivorans]|uniref:VRR-NUC domain-containing protein n=1 Tax=Burkholderia multivorans TaxID=87883 RepID=UPI0020194E8F|nr:VRR-NUC domain-containing protein [Burkholderia multivorans]EKS9914192.1 VRR-NUC domain-containing protein [Burkholderia multivorans]MCL4650381.1 VRR-NUC domain-containing protein [Burkholderia multivorans]MCL4656404.1 VRR-NUC domain-containing protein [Burkholderia multivorans]MCO1424882.1 VRR-NUC domain-containing protein [Burkholderia multivorans]MCO1462740.1 VRR-NUC domain-containing protein [Burkholderia multivorans]
MTDYAQGRGSGSTEPGDGRTTRLRLRRNTLDAQDREALCAVICKCNAMPTIGVDGQRLKQQCVSGRLKAADAISDHQSPYKAEINYDMSRDPPAPIMDSGLATKAHEYLPGWIQKYWPGGLGGYTRGVGNIRRPDVVIVNDPALPPTQDNIKNVVEIKFPPDRRDNKQQAAYARIAGDSSKVAVMQPSDCGCSDADGTRPAPSTSRVTSSDLDDVLGTGLDSYARGAPPPMPPTPIPVP